MLNTVDLPGGVNGFDLVIGAGDLVQEVQHICPHRILKQLFSRGGLVERQETLSYRFIGNRREKIQIWEHPRSFPGSHHKTKKRN